MYIVFKKLLVAYTNLLACIRFPLHASIVHPVINHCLRVQISEKYHPLKLGGCQERNADGQFTRPFGKGAYNF